MPLPVPDRPSPFRLSAVKVGNPVARRHGQRLINDLAFLHAYNVQSIADTSLDYDTGGTTPLDLSVFYARSPGAQALLVGLELIEADSAQATCTFTDDAGDPLDWLVHNGLDGSRALAPPPATTSIPQQYWGVVDVSALPTDGTLQRLNLEYVRTSAAAGVRRVFAREVPQAQVDPAGDPTAEPGASPAWPDYRPGVLNAATGLVDGSATSNLGWVRLHDQLEQARLYWRAWRQWCYWEFDAFAPTTTSTSYGAFTWGIGGTYTPKWWTRSRRLYGTTTGTAVAETVNAVVRYKCTAASGGHIRITTYDGTTSVDNDFAVANSAAYATAALGTLPLPTNNTDQRVRVMVTGKVDSAGALYVPNITLYSA